MSSRAVRRNSLPGRRVRRRRTPEGPGTRAWATADNVDSLTSRDRTGSRARHPRDLGQNASGILHISVSYCSVQHRFPIAIQRVGRTNSTGTENARRQVRDRRRRRPRRFPCAFLSKRTETPKKPAVSKEVSGRVARSSTVLLGQVQELLTIATDVVSGAGSCNGCSDRSRGNNRISG